MLRGKLIFLWNYAKFGKNQTVNYFVWALTWGSRSAAKRSAEKLAMHSLTLSYPGNLSNSVFPRLLFLSGRAGGPAIIDLFFFLSCWLSLQVKTPLLSPPFTMAADPGLLSGGGRFSLSSWTHVTGARQKEGRGSWVRRLTESSTVLQKSSWPIPES